MKFGNKVIKVDFKFYFFECLPRFVLVNENNNNNN